MPQVNSYTPKPDAPEATLVVSATKTDVIDLYGTTLLGFITDTNLTGTAITFEVCDTVDGTFVELRGSDNTAVSFTVATAKAYHVNPQHFAAWRFMKLVSGTTQATNPSVFKILADDIA